MRRLSKYQKREWMTEIRKKRKWNPTWKGESHPRCRISDKQVEMIRERLLKASYVANLVGISERYVYQLRAGERRK